MALKISFKSYTSSSCDSGLLGWLHKMDWLVDSVQDKLDFSHWCHCVTSDLLLDSPLMAPFPLPPRFAPFFPPPPGPVNKSEKGDKNISATCMPLPTAIPLTSALAALFLLLLRRNWQTSRARSTGYAHTILKKIVIEGEGQLFLTKLVVSGTELCEL